MLVTVKSWIAAVLGRSVRPARPRRGWRCLRLALEQLEDRCTPTTVSLVEPQTVLRSPPDALTNVNGTLFFRTNDISTGYELWKSDGTAAGTVLVKDINPAGSSSPVNLTNVNGT